jgi:hypothetical protein
MSIHTRLPALVALATLALATPVLAQDAPAVPADANKALWCATAFTMVEPQARQAGDTVAADNFLKYSKALTTTSQDGLKKAGFTDDQVTATTAKYKDTVNKQLTPGGAPDFTVVDCTALVDPAAAAAIQATSGAPAAAPADGTAAPAAVTAPATPAPAAPAADATTPATPAK